MSYDIVSAYYLQSFKIGWGTRYPVTADRYSEQVMPLSPPRQSWVKVYFGDLTATNQAVGVLDQQIGLITADIYVPVAEGESTPTPLKSMAAYARSVLRAIPPIEGYSIIPQAVRYQDLFHTIEPPGFVLGRVAQAIWYQALDEEGVRMLIEQALADAGSRS